MVCPLPFKGFQTVLLPPDMYFHIKAFNNHISAIVCCQAGSKESDWWLSESALQAL